MDFTTAAGRGIIERLVRGSQVLVENFTPGELEKRGLGPARIEIEEKQWPRAVKELGMPMGD